MTNATGVLKRAWNFPLLVRHESLMVLSQSFLGATSAGGVSFDLLQFPCSVGSRDCFGAGPNANARARRR
jgi:hypothetical protein